MSAECTLITGAGSGIGKRIAIQLSKNSPLIICGRNSNKLLETLAACTNPQQHFTWEFDLENASGVKHSLEKYLTEKGLTVNAFIHSAGMVKVGHMKNMDYATAIQMFNVNFFSASEIVSVLLKKKVNQSRLKNIVFISAIIGEFGARGHNIYSSTKSALDGLMKSLAVELAPEVRINSILPGGVKTPMSEAAYNDPVILENALNEYPLGIGEPEDIANMVEFLISEKARWITGQQIIVDGGRTVNISHK